MPVVALSGTAGAKKPAVEKPSGGTVSETGSTLLYPLFNLWSSGYSTAFPSVTIQTAGTGSGTGITDATNGTADIGASDAYLSPAEVQASPGLLNIPLAISAQLITYNIQHLSGQDHQLERVRHQGAQSDGDPPQSSDCHPSPL